MEANLDIYDMLYAVANNLDASFFLLLVQNLELSFLLPIIQRSHNDLISEEKVIHRQNIDQGHIQR